MKRIASVLVWLAFFILPYEALPADKLLGVHSARVMSQSMPWIAEEAGLFRKYDLEFPLVYIGSSPLATAAMLGGDGELLMDGGLGIVRAYVQGNTELVCIGGKNILTRYLGRRRSGDWKIANKKVGVTRIGATTHYFATQASQSWHGRDETHTMVQTGGRRRCSQHSLRLEPELYRRPWMARPSPKVISTSSTVPTSVFLKWPWAS
jgi:hypothetical protein